MIGENFWCLEASIIKEVILLEVVKGEILAALALGGNEGLVVFSKITDHLLLRISIFQ